MTWKIFCTTDVSFLRVAHTHKHIDQTFKRTSEQVRSNDAFALGDLHTQLRQTYGGRAKVVYMVSIINW